jgi:hypothetical protein
MVVCFAGPYAQARYTRRSAFETVFVGGKQDYRNAELVARCAFGDDHQAHMERATEAAREFVRRPDVWAQITTVANILSVKGYMKGTHPELVRIQRSADAQIWPGAAMQVVSAS